MTSPVINDCWSDGSLRICHLADWTTEAAPHLIWSLLEAFRNSAGNPHVCVCLQSNTRFLPNWSPTAAAMFSISTKKLLQAAGDASVGSDQEFSGVPLVIQTLESLKHDPTRTRVPPLDGSPLSYCRKTSSPKIKMVEGQVEGQVGGGGES